MSRDEGISWLNIFAEKTSELVSSHNILSFFLIWFFIGNKNSNYLFNINKNDLKFRDIGKVKKCLKNDYLWAKDRRLRSCFFGLFIIVFVSSGVNTSKISD